MSDEFQNKKRQGSLWDSVLSRGSGEMQSGNVTWTVIFPLPELPNVFQSGELTCFWGQRASLTMHP